MHFYRRKFKLIGNSNKDSLVSLTYHFLRSLLHLLLIITILSDKSPAQGSYRVDSLIEVLNTQKEDSNKVKTLNILSKQLWQKSSYVESNEYAVKALTLADSIVFSTGKVDAFNTIGKILARRGNYTEGLRNHFSGLRISEEISYKKGIADSYNGIAGIYYAQGNYPEALKNLSSFLKIAEEIGDKRGVAVSLNNMGLIYISQGNYPEAQKCYLASLRIREEMQDKMGISSSLVNIGQIYSKQGNYPQALHYYFASLKIKEEIGDRLGVAFTYNSIGMIYYNQNNFPEAFKNCSASLKINEQIGHKSGIADSHSSIGLIYEKEKNHSAALINHKASLKIMEDIGDQKGIACSSINIGLSYTSLDSFIEARRFLNDGLALSLKIGSKDDIKVSYERLARLDSLTGNWESALGNYKLFILYRDSLLNEDNSKKIMQAQMQYDFNKKEDSLKYVNTITNEILKQQYLFSRQQQQSLLLKERENSIMVNEKKLQDLEIEKNHVSYAMQKSEADKKHGQLLILNKEKAIQDLQLNRQKLLKNLSLILLVLFSILSFFIYINYRTRQKLNLQTLRNKIASDLHDDVGSTLSSISIFSQLMQQQSKEVMPMLETIEESSRKMLDAMADIVWTINPENDQFEKIVLRMRSFAFEMLGAKNIDFEFIADEEAARSKLLMDVRKNIYLIFKEATNNMVKYSETESAFFSLKREKNYLNLIIHDNGKGFDISHSTEGNGLKNMKKRAHDIGGKIIIDSCPGKGTTIELNVSV